MQCTIIIIMLHFVTTYFNITSISMLLIFEVIIFTASYLVCFCNKFTVFL